MPLEALKPIVIDLPPRFVALLDKTAQDLGTTRGKLIARCLKRDYNFIIRYEAPPSPKFEQDLDARYRRWAYENEATS